jgi:hypothetical protein
VQVVYGARVPVGDLWRRGTAHAEAQAHALQRTQRLFGRGAAQGMRIDYRQREVRQTPVHPFHRLLPCPQVRAWLVVHLAFDNQAQTAKRDQHIGQGMGQTLFGQRDQPPPR